MAAVLYVPVGTKEDASEIARYLISNRLAVCVNIIPSITSVYEWNGSIEETQEVLMIVKTTKALVKRTTISIEKMHQYDIPCIAEINISSLNKKYIDWMSTFLKQKR